MYSCTLVLGIFLLLTPCFRLDLITSAHLLYTDYTGIICSQTAWNRFPLVGCSVSSSRSEMVAMCTVYQHAAYFYVLYTCTQRYCSLAIPPCFLLHVLTNGSDGWLSLMVSVLCVCRLCVVPSLVAETITYFITTTTTLSVTTTSSTSAEDEYMQVIVLGEPALYQVGVGLWVVCDCFLLPTVVI